jgi:hypothetical protein
MFPCLSQAIDLTEVVLQSIPMTVCAFMDGALPAK